MKTHPTICLADVQAVYSGPEGDLWELVMGEQIHIGGLSSSTDLADRAGIGAGSSGVDLCCCNGAGMRFLVRFRGVAKMTGVDATAAVIERGRRRNAAQGLTDRIDFIQSDVCHTPLPPGQADFVWGEDAWCYVADKDRLLQEALRIVRPGGTVAFTDWMEGPAGLTDEEARRFLTFMKFPSVQTLDGYARALERAGGRVADARDTGRFAPYADLYVNMLTMQLTGDALRIIGFDAATLEGLGAEMEFLRQLAHAGKVIQGLLVARRP